MPRHEYRVSRSSYSPSRRVVPEGQEIRHPVLADRLQLASLMMDAYVGTIDYQGETDEQAVEEVDGYLAVAADLPVSYVMAGGGAIQSACLVSRLAGIPVIAYLMTRAERKNRGLAAALLDASMNAIWAAGHEEVRAFITAGNLPSERIFARAGFEVIATYEE